VVIHIRIMVCSIYTILTEPFETLKENKKNSSFQVVSSSDEATQEVINVGV